MKDLPRKAGEKFSRRSILKIGGASAAGLLLAGLPRGWQGAAWASDAPETTRAKLGFIALTDCSPLVIAKEKGFFTKYGLPDVEVIKQASWGATRDNLELGSAQGGIDGAHILTPMPYAMSQGVVTKNNRQIPMYVIARLNTNGQSISLSMALRDKGINTAQKLKPLVDEARTAGKPMKFAMTFPTGTHNYWLRYWLASGGINPDRDVQVIVVPPPQMVANMKVGNMDGFCVGEPWNAQTVTQKIGFTCMTTQQLWKNHPEKALSLRADYADKNPKAVLALLMAVMEAQRWADKLENKSELCSVVSGKSWINCPAPDILGRQRGETDYGDGRVEKDPNYMRFWDGHASYPYKSHDTWFLAESRRWGFFPKGIDYAKVVGEVNRSDLWKQAATSLGLAAEIPGSDSRGVETFFDGVTFDPADPEGYLNKLSIKNIQGTNS